MTAVVFLAEGFEEVEALAPVDCLRRAGVKVITCAVGKSLAVKGSHGVTINADITENDLVLPDDTALVVLPGGMPGSRNLAKSPIVEKTLELVSKKGYLAAICAAPTVLGKYGYLRKKKACCYPGYEKELQGAELTDSGVTVDGNIITAAGAGLSLDFALTLVEILVSGDTAKKLRDKMLCR